MLVSNASVNSSCTQPPLPPPPGYRGAFAHLVSRGSGTFANFVLPGAIPELSTHTRFPIRI